MLTQKEDCTCPWSQDLNKDVKRVLQFLEELQLHFHCCRFPQKVPEKIRVIEDIQKNTKEYSRNIFVDQHTGAAPKVSQFATMAIVGSCSVSPSPFKPGSHPCNSKMIQLRYVHSPKNNMENSFILLAHTSIWDNQFKQIAIYFYFPDSKRVGGYPTRYYT